MLNNNLHTLAQFLRKEICFRQQASVLVLLTTRRVVELSFAPLLVRALPNNYVVTDASKRCQYIPANRGAAAIACGGEVTTEQLIDFIKCIILGQFAPLLDG
jgi:hypothetical protein